MQQLKKLGVQVGIAVGSVGALVVALTQSASAQLTTATLGASIDTVNGTFMDYFTVLLDKYWPFVVGVGVLILVWHFGRRALNAFN